MKVATDNNGNVSEVSDDTPVKTIDGVHYLLTTADIEEVNRRQVEWLSGANGRALQQMINNRKKEYGSIENQIEFITENGLAAWQAKVAQIKLNNPK